MPDDAHEIQRLRDENLRLRSALETALLMAEQAAAGLDERIEAKSVIDVITEALERQDG